MDETLAGVRSAMEAFASRFEPATCSVTTATRVLAEATAIKNMIAAIEALAARREADCGDWRRAGHRSPAEAARLVGEATSAGTAVKVIARVDLGPLLGLAPTEGEVCDLGGVSVAPSVIEDLLSAGSAFLAAVITDGTQLTGVAHLGRRPTAKQRTALEFLYPTCAVERCTQSVRLEIRQYRAVRGGRFSVLGKQIVA